MCFTTVQKKHLLEPKWMIINIQGRRSKGNQTELMVELQMEVEVRKLMAKVCENNNHSQFNLLLLYVILVDKDKFMFSDWYIQVICFGDKVNIIM